MSEGYLNETFFHRPYVKDADSLVQEVKYPTSPPPFKAGDVRFPTYITTFRSGPGYARSLQLGSLPPSGGSSYTEVLAHSVGDSGHEFSLDKTELFDSSVKSTGHPYYFPAGCNSPIVGKNAVWIPLIDGHSPTFNPDARASAFRTTDNDLRGQGTDFIAFTNPLKSQADLLVSIAEIVREGFPRVLAHNILHPSLKKGRKQRVSALGGEYLNYVFGYQPIVSDIVRVYDAISRIDEIVEQWIRDNGQTVRRRRRVTKPSKVRGLDGQGYVGGSLGSFSARPPISTDLPYSWSTSFGNPSNHPYTYVQTGQEIIDEDISFSSQFVYDLSQLRLTWGDNENINAQNPDLRSYLGLHALGLSPTDLNLKVFWELVPFSWLVDWVTNVGSLLDNQRSYQTAGLRVNYAYITSTATKRLFLDTLIEWPGYMSIHSKVNVRQKSVRRLQATPFGFDVKYSDLTGNQTSILAALAASYTKI